MSVAHERLRAAPGDPQAIEASREATENARKTFTEEKSRAWRDFASTLDSSTPDSKVWQVVRTMDGRGKEALPDTPIQADDKIAYTDKNKADLVMATYAEVSRVIISRQDSKDAYLAVRSYLRNTPADDDKNGPFTTSELDRVLATPAGKASGPDGVGPAGPCSRS